jgi:hypothetical protein
MLLPHIVERAAEEGAVTGNEQVLGCGDPGLPGPLIAFGTDRSPFTTPSSDSAWPLRSPVAVAVAVNSGLDRVDAVTS